MESWGEGGRLGEKPRGNTSAGIKHYNSEALCPPACPVSGATDTGAGHTQHLQRCWQTPLHVAHGSEVQETPTILRKDEQLLCDLPLEAAVTQGWGVGRYGRLLRGPQSVVCIVDDFWGRHSRPGSVDVWEPEEGSGLDGLRGFFNIELQTQITLVSP